MRSKRIRHVFVRDLELEANIGVYRREKGRLQPVRINVDLTVEETEGEIGDNSTTSSTTVRSWTASRRSSRAGI